MKAHLIVFMKENVSCHVCGEIVHSERAYEGSYDSSREGKLAIGLLSNLWRKVYTERAQKCTYDGLYGGKIPVRNVWQRVPRTL